MKLQPVKSRPKIQALDSKEAEIVQFPSAISGDIPQIVPPKPLGAVGRPRKGETWRDVLSRLMNEEADVSGVTFREEVGKKVRQLARAGVPWAIQFLADREDGRPAQSIVVEPGSRRNPMLDLDDDTLRDVIEEVRRRRLGS